MPNRGSQTQQLTFTDCQIIDAICDEFESACKSENAPDLNDFVARLPAHLMQPGLLDLVVLDAFYNGQAKGTANNRATEQTKQSGTSVQPRSPDGDLWMNYVSRFPILANLAAPDELAVQNAELIGGRFKTLRRHAAGGLGKVSIASDLQFNRQVAIKEINSAYANNRAYQHRFLREAEITGQLEHPGIVPVYVLGKRSNGEPYYAMRLIRGQSMQAAISELHDSPDRATLPRRRRQLLNRFVDVCNATEYSHSRGVVHRDIKPQNIMLGDFGETLLVDWGLAKHLDESEASLRLPDAEQAELSKTLSGTVLGTLGYMSPEQAAGDVDSVNQRSDLYSLGATLFHLLTGKSPPVDLQTLNKQTSKLRACLEEANLPKPLVAICLKAMQPRPERRYESARNLAADLELALADEPVSVCADPIWTRVRRWIQRHPAISSAGLATVCLLFVGLIAFSWLTGAHANEVDLKNRQLDELVKLETQLRIDAQTSEKRTSDAMDFMADALRSPDPNLKGRDVRVIDVLADAAKHLDEDFEDDPLLQARVLNAIGFTYYRLADYKESARLLERCRALYLEHLGEYAHQTLIAGKNLGNAWLKLGDERAFGLLEDVSRKTRQTFGDDDPLTLHFQRVLAMAKLDQGDTTGAVADLEELYPRYTKIHGDESQELLSLQGSLAEAYFRSGEIQKAVKINKSVYIATLESRGPLALSTIVSGGVYANSLLETNERDKAQPLLTLLLTNARKSLGNSHATTIMLIRKLGGYYLDVANLEKGIPLVEEAHHLSTQLYGANHQLSLTSANSLGIAYMAMGDYESSVEQFKHVYELSFQQRGGDHPETLTMANNLAAAYRLNNQLDAAVELFTATLNTQIKNLGRGNPKTVLTMVNLASGLQSASRYAESIPVCREVVELAERIETDHLYSQIAMSLEGAAQLELQDFEAAKTVITKCLESRIRTVPNHWLRYLTTSMLGEAELGLKNDDAAEPLLLEGYEKLVELESTIPVRAKFRIGEAKERLVRFYEARNMPDKAAKYQDKK